MFRGGHNLVSRHQRALRDSQRREDQMEPLIGIGDEEAALPHAHEDIDALRAAEAQVRQDFTPEPAPSAPTITPSTSSSPFSTAHQQLEVRQEGKTKQEEPGHNRLTAPLPGQPSRTSWQRAGRMVQGANMLAREARSGVPHTHLPGSVQGIDLKRSPQEWSWLSSQWVAGRTSILCLDFSSEKVALHPNIKPSGLADFLKEPRPAWSKVRWINMDGLSWEAIQSVALHFDLHPLAVEDIVHIPQRIKADLYEHFMYISCHLITLATDYNHPPYAPPQTLRPVLKSAIAAAAAARPGIAGRGPHHLTSPGAAAAVAAAAAGAAAPPLGPSAATMAAGKSGPVMLGTVLNPEQQQAGISFSAAGRPQMPDGGLAPMPGPTTSEVAAHLVDDDVAQAMHELELGGDHNDLHMQPGRRLGRMTSVSMPNHRSDAPAAQRNCIQASSLLRRMVSKCGGAATGAGARRAGQYAGDSLDGPPPAPPPAAAQHPHMSAGTAELLETGVPVHKQQVSILVLDSNTMVSIFESAGTAVTRPLLQQLREPGTLARDARDASYLACILLDALADSAYPVVDAYSGIVEGYEARILGSKPDPGETKDLHLIQGDLATLRRTLLPTLHLVTGLRTHNIDARSPVPASTTNSSAAATAHTARTALLPGRPPSPAPQQQQQPVTTSPANGGGAANGGGGGGGGSAAHRDGHPGPTFTLHPLVTRLTKTYLGDVQDHLTSLLDALDSQTEACRDLIDLAFNLIAHRTNQAMQTLTVVSVLFLPLTFLAGIYGMNFDFMPELHWHYGYVYFYGLSLGIVAVFLVAMYRLGMMS